MNIDISDEEAKNILSQGLQRCELIWLASLCILSFVGGLSAKEFGYDSVHHALMITFMLTCLITAQRKSTTNKFSSLIEKIRGLTNR